MTNVILAVSVFIGTNTPPVAWNNTNCIAVKRDGDYYVVQYVEHGKTNEQFFWTGGFRLVVETNLLTYHHTPR